MDEGLSIRTEADYNRAMHKIFFLFFCGVYLMLNSCTYSSSTIINNIANVIRKPDSRIIAVLVNKTTLQQPTGLSTFPDGGRSKILEIELNIYLFDIDNKKLSTLLVLKNPPNQLEGFNSWLKGWDEDDLYFMTRGCAPTFEVYSKGCGESNITNQYFKVNSQGVSQRVTTFPTNLVQGRNSPLVAWRDEINYTRISNDSNSIDVTTTDSNGFHKVLKLDNLGNLRHIPKPK